MERILSIRKYLVFILSLVSVVCHSQGQVPNKTTLIQRATEGQTKWMVSQLKLDSSLYTLVLRINYKYQVKTDSIRMINMQTSDRNEFYLLLCEKKNKEFKQILAPKVYKEYLGLLESVKVKVSSTQYNP